MAGASIFAPGQVSISTMTSHQSAQCRLYVLLSRDGRSAAILRRGPTKRVLLIRWVLRGDRFEIGAWFKGRIYEERCDLSPNGEFLLYFAGHRRPYHTWTAISRVPYLTALALWPQGSTWHGGGLFDSHDRVRLNHLPHRMALAPGFSVPPNFKVLALRNSSIERARLAGLGWQVKSREGHLIVSERRQPAQEAGCGIVLQRSERLPVPRNRGIEGEDYVVLNGTGKALRVLPYQDWCDWGCEGDLLVSKDGRLFRIDRKAVAAETSDAMAGVHEIADFRDLPFEPSPPPAWATKW